MEAPYPQSSNSAGEPEDLSPLDAARIVDSVAPGRVLVFGSPPPGGRDLDLLARPTEEQAIAARLAEVGFVRRGAEWALFRDCGAAGVDLVSAAEWNLPEGELEALFDEAIPLEGFESLVEPSAHHALLIAARRVARAGAYPDKLRARVAEVVADDPGAWDAAERRARAWSAAGALERLRELHDGERVGAGDRARAVGERLRAAASRRRAMGRAVRRAARRPAIVALSGLDGAGKSFQAERLADELGRLGIRATVVWPSATNVMYQANPRVKRVLRRVLGLLGRSPSEASAPAPDLAAGADAAGEPPLPRQAAPVAHALALIVSVVQAWSFRRGARQEAHGADVVIYDRYALDSIVYLRHRWGQGRPLRLQSALLRRLSRRPAAAFLLDVRPEVAYERKRDFPLDNLRERARLYGELHERLGVTRVDGERPRDEICAEIGRAVWRQVG